MAMKFERRWEIVQALRYQAGGYKKLVSISDDNAREIADELERIHHAIVRAHAAPAVTLTRELAQEIVDALDPVHAGKARAELLRLMGINRG